MFFLLLVTSISIFTKIGKGSISKYIHSSLITPTFIAYVVKDDPSCAFLMTHIEKFGKALKDEVVIGLADCQESYTECAEFGIVNFPSFFLYHAPDSSLAKQYHGEIVFEDIKKFILEHIYPQRVFVDKLEDSYINKSKFPDHSIVVASQSVGDEIITGLERLAPFLNVPVVVLRSSKPIIHIVEGPKCIERYPGSLNFREIASFVKDRRFSVFHRFKGRELFDFDQAEGAIGIDVTSNGRKWMFWRDWKRIYQSSIIISSTDKLTQNSHEVLNELSSSYCGRSRLGWFNINSDPDIASFFGAPTDRESLLFLDGDGKSAYVFGKNLNARSADVFLRNITGSAALLDAPNDPEWPKKMAAIFIGLIFLIKAIKTCRVN